MIQRLYQVEMKMGCHQAEMLVEFHQIGMKIGRYDVVQSGNLDGIKFFLDAPQPNHGAEAWVLMRASGTEPLMRVYCEAASPETVKQILADAEAFVFERSTAA